MHFRTNGSGVMQNHGDLAAAEGLCMRLLDYGPASKERAKALLREIRSLQVRCQVDHTLLEI